MFETLTPNVRYWSRFSEEKQIDFNGTWIRSDGEAVLVDPVPMSEEQLQAVRSDVAPSAIVITNKDHRRAAVDLRTLLGGVPIWIHEADRELLGATADRTFKDGDRLPAGLRAIHLASLKSPGETALLFEGDPSVMILGDALIGKPAGQLALLPVPKVADHAAARASLRRLLEHPFDALMLGDGTPFRSGGRAALESFLAA